jgi:hypothetical protein
MTAIAGTLLMTTSDLDGNYSILVSTSEGPRQISNLSVEMILVLHENLPKDNYVDFTFVSKDEGGDPFEEQ